MSAHRFAVYASLSAIELALGIGILTLAFLDRRSRKRTGCRKSRLDLIAWTLPALALATFSECYVGHWAIALGEFLVFLGSCSNGLALYANDGYMPVFGKEGISTELMFRCFVTGKHRPGNQWTKHRWACDRISLNLPFHRGIASVGDVSMSLGVLFMLGANARTCIELTLRHGR